MEDLRKMPKKTFSESTGRAVKIIICISILLIYVDHNKAVDGDAYLKMALELELQDGEDCYHREEESTNMKKIMRQT